MRWSVVMAALVAAAAACSDEQLQGKVAGLSGVYDVVVVGEYAFVTSADKDELRVLSVGNQLVDWVRGPNPIEPLAVPVSVNSPVGLARDVTYSRNDEFLEDDTGVVQLALLAGDEVTGPYVYVRGTGTSDIAVVNADEPNSLEKDPGSDFAGKRRPEALKEWLKLSTQGTVTAMAGHGPSERPACLRPDDAPAPVGRTHSILYYAVTLAQGAELRAQDIPAPCVQQDVAREAREAQLAPARVLLTDPASIVTALAVMPDGQLAVARRNRSGGGGTTVLLDPVTLAQREMRFPAAVRLLATHPAPTQNAEDAERGPLDEPRGADGQPAAISAGRYLFGVLDETSCGGQDACRGVVAVDTLTGDVAIDYTGRPMQPFRTGSALPTGLSITALRTRVEADASGRGRFSLLAGSQVVTNTGTAEKPQLQVESVTTPTTVPGLVGMVPASNGRYTVFDAVRLVSIDNNGLAPWLTEVRPAGSSQAAYGTAIDWSLALRRGNGVPVYATSQPVGDHLLRAPKQPEDPNEPRLPDLSPKVSGGRQDVGTSFNETLQLGFEFVIASSADLSRPRDLARPLEYDVSAEAFAQVFVGDVVEVYGVRTDDEGRRLSEECTEDGLRIVRKELLPGPVHRLYTDAPPPEGCNARNDAVETGELLFPYYFVRATANGPDSGPFIVYGSLSGYMGRYGEFNRNFVFQGRELYRASVPRTPGASSEDRSRVDPLPPAITFTYSGTPDPQMKRGYFYELRADTNYTPFEFTLETGSSSFFNYRVPGTVSYSYLRNSYVVTYPSADAIVLLKRDEVLYGSSVRAGEGAYSYF